MRRARMMLLGVCLAMIAGCGERAAVPEPRASEVPVALVAPGPERPVVPQTVARAVQPTRSPRLPMCPPGPRDNCVVDGDTFWLGGEKIRIADIDTPETGQPMCPAELALGQRATARLRELLNAGPFELEMVATRDRDRNGRLLRVVTRGGRSLGDVLVAEGLARTWTGRREPWC